MTMSKLTEIPDENTTPSDPVSLKNENLALKNENLKLKKQATDQERLILHLYDQVSLLKDEINRLKGQKPRPKFPGSGLEHGNKSKGGSQNNSRNQGTPPPNLFGKIRSETRCVEPENVPPGSRFKGYQNFHVQELNIEVLKIQYRLKLYETPEGKILHGRLPQELNGKHFGPGLIAYCLDQYYGRSVTRPVLLEQLIGFGLKISVGELDAILIDNKEDFHREKEDVFEAGIANSDYLHTDDTGARHDGENGYCTLVGSPLFSHFESTRSKSRINFLEILRGRHRDYILSSEALMYAFEQGISDKTQEILDSFEGKRFKNKGRWEAFLKKQGIFSEKDIRVATEATLLGSATTHGLRPNMEIISDSAGQFNVLVHALCWVHEERHYRKFIPVTDEERTLLEGLRDSIWDIYERLKAYKKNPIGELKRQIEMDFEGIFSCVTESDAINSLLMNTLSRKEGLLRVLEYPWLPLHNNDSERDIREYVKRRKISGSTRSEAGKKARDTFMSLKKTCKKLGVPFWDYLRDRVARTGKIEPLADIIIVKARTNPA